ncbi:hypothetical protein GCM10009634_01900 [Saccharothrix xinjiangensis]
MTGPTPGWAGPLEDFPSAAAVADGRGATRPLIDEPDLETQRESAAPTSTPRSERNSVFVAFGAGTEVGFGPRTG